MPRLDHIEMDGVLYEFTDQVARDQINSLASREYGDNERLSGAISDEVQRATDAERALELSKVSIEGGKGLSENDFTDEYKALVDDPIEVSVGQKGVAPAPSVDDVGKYLDATGNWSVPPDTQYDEATVDTAGLMSAEDKEKVNALEPYWNSDDNKSAHIVTYDGGVNEFFEDGKQISVIFNDNTITKNVYMNGAADDFAVITRFNTDGTIDRQHTYAEHGTGGNEPAGPLNPGE